MNSFIYASLAVLLVLSLTSCGSSNSGSADGNPQAGLATSEVKRFGLVEVQSFSRQGDVFATFREFETTLSASQFNSRLVLPSDECRLTINGNVVEDGLTMPTMPEFSYISGGETVILTSPAGTYATLVKITQDDAIRYDFTDPGTSLALPVPTGLTVDITGDDFPAFSNVPIPNAEPVVLTSPPRDSPITPDTQFIWEPGSYANGQIFMDVDGTSGADNAYVSCVLSDDGAFSFPESIKSGMGIEFSGMLFDFDRIIRRGVQRGNSLLILGSSSDSHSDPDPVPQ